jgi:hypothetical protein
LKKEAKTFGEFRWVVRHGERLDNKSFLVLFFKKEPLSFYFLPQAGISAPGGAQGGRPKRGAPCP